MKNVFVMDACALIAFLADEEGADRVESVLTAAKNGKCQLYMNTINVLEVFYGVYREDGKERAGEVLEKIAHLPIKVIGNLKTGVFKEAGRLKATNVPVKQFVIPIVWKWGDYD